MAEERRNREAGVAQKTMANESSLGRQKKKQEGHLEQGNLTKKKERVR